MHKSVTFNFSIRIHYFVPNNSMSPILSPSSSSSSLTTCKSFRRRKLSSCRRHSWQFRVQAVDGRLINFCGKSLPSSTEISIEKCFLSGHCSKNKIAFDLFRGPIVSLECSECIPQLHRMTRRPYNSRKCFSHLAIFVLIFHKARKKFVQRKLFHVLSWLCIFFGFEIESSKISSDQTVAEPVDY